MHTDAAATAAAILVVVVVVVAVVDMVVPSLLDVMVGVLVLRKHTNG